MKILKIFGIVVGIHVFALVLIFANPGCSSSTKPPPAPGDTMAAAPAPSLGDQSVAPPAAVSSEPSPAITFNPDAPAVAGAASPSPGVRYTPTRPGTPAAGTLVAEPVVDVTPATTYTVKSGDSLWTIAKKHHITVAQLAAANSLKTNANLKPSQKLLIPGKPASPTAAATANPAAAQGKTAETVAARPATTTTSGGLVKHTVKSGETLGGIARNYGVRSGDIAVANNISDPAKIRPGMELVIPGWETPGSKAKAAKSTKTPAPAATPKSSPPATPPTIQIDTPPPAQSDSAPQVPVIRIDESPSPIVPAPKEP